jgi:hypothetical protein
MTGRRGVAQAESMVDTSAPTRGGPRRSELSRRRVLVAVALVIPTGMLLRQLPGEVGNLAAGACFPILFALLIRLVWPRMTTLACAGIAFGISASIEAAQLTPIPAMLTDAFPPAYWLVGSTFAPLDLVGYAVGAAAVVALAPLLTRRRGPSDPVRRPATPNGRGQ